MAPAGNCDQANCEGILISHVGRNVAVVCVSLSHKFVFGGGPDATGRTRIWMDFSCTELSASHMGSAELSVIKMNDLKLVVRHMYKQLQCGLGCAGNHMNNKTRPHKEFGREGDLASSISS